MRVLVLGKNGMLGGYVYNYLSEYFEVIGTTRRELDATTATIDLVASNIKSGDVVVNCIGIVPQRGNPKKIDFVAVNSMFPLIVQEACNKKGAKFIHITTDCVFNGLWGDYDEEDEHDTYDIYGATKSIGEPENATIVRTSIIGEEKYNFCSLLEWVKLNKGKEISGFTNHIWNGITCLQFAKICKYIIDNNIFWRGVKHIMSPNPITKYELVKLISEVYNLNIKVTPYTTEVTCDRTLSSVRTDVSINVPDLRTQLIEMKDFKKK
jgi:dTDP-4-dehydrorhamnose reductase